MPECKHDWYSIGVARHKCSKCDLVTHDCDDHEANDESWLSFEQFDIVPDPWLTDDYDEPKEVSDE
jgi:hypothetical protein